jgi:hypothetical protein
VPDPVQIDTTLNRQNCIQNHTVKGRRPLVNRTAVNRYEKASMGFAREIDIYPIIHSSAQILGSSKGLEQWQIACRVARDQCNKASIWSTAGIGTAGCGVVAEA